MRASSTPHRRPGRYNTQLRIKLDAAGQTTLAAFCTAIRRRPPQVLRQVIAWGLGDEARWHVDRQRVPHAVQTCYVILEPETRTRVHAAARLAHGDASTWVGHVLQQMTLNDLPADWQPSEAARKRCAVCAHEQPLPAFRRTQRAPDGYLDYCKNCAPTSPAERLRAYAQRHRERLRVYRRHYYDQRRAQHKGCE